MVNQVDNFKTHYLQSILVDLAERTEDMVASLKDFDIFIKFNQWYSDTPVLNKIQNISKLFPRLGLSPSQVLTEYTALRDEHLPINPSVFETIEKQSQYIHQHTSFENLKIIYTILLIFPFSTVANESGFSHMNAIKTRFRNKLKSENLENLMFLALYPSEVIDYESLAFEIESKFTFT